MITRSKQLFHHKSRIRKCSKKRSEIIQTKEKSIKNVTYAYPQGGKTPKLYQGKSSMIVMGYLDSDKTKCEYVLLTSDGKKTT